MLPARHLTFPLAIRAGVAPDSVVKSTAAAGGAAAATDRGQARAGCGGKAQAAAAARANAAGGQSAVTPGRAELGVRPQMCCAPLASEVDVEADMDLRPPWAGSGNPPLGISSRAPSRRILPHHAISSVHTLKLTSVLGPKVWVIGTSEASRPRAISTRPTLGTRLRGSKVCQLPPI